MPNTILECAPACSSTSQLPNSVCVDDELSVPMHDGDVVDHLLGDHLLGNVSNCCGSRMQGWMSLLDR